MKYSKAEVHCKTHGLPALRFEDSQLTSFSGLILLQALFARLGLKERLRRCFSHLTVSAIFGHATAGTVLSAAPHTGIPAVARYPLLFLLVARRTAGVLVLCLGLFALLCAPPVLHRDHHSIEGNGHRDRLRGDRLLPA